jgi:WD40 repeat protein
MKSDNEPPFHIQKKAVLTGHNASIFSLSKGGDDRHFLSGGGEGWVVEWNLDAPDLGRLLAKTETQIFSLLKLTDQPVVIAGNMNGGVHWIHLENPNQSKDVQLHRKGVFDIKVNGDYVYTVGGDGILTKWSAAEARSLESFHLTNQPLRCMDFCEKRGEIAIGASDHAVYLLDIETLALKNVIRDAHGNSVFSIKYSPTGEYLLTGGRDAHLNVWDTKTWERRSSQPAHWYTINGIDFHPSGHFFATASRDKTLKIWRSDNFELVKVLEGARDGGHLNSVNKLLWMKNGESLVSCSDDRTIISWQIRQGG